MKNKQAGTRQAGMQAGKGIDRSLVGMISMVGYIYLMEYMVWNAISILKQTKSQLTKQLQYRIKSDVLY